MSRADASSRWLSHLRHLSWAVAVVCLGIWGLARLDVARFEGEAEARLARETARRSSAAERDARALERAVERQLEGLERPPPPADAASGRAAPAAEPTPASPATVSRRAESPAGSPTVDGTEVLGRLRIPRLGLSVLVAEGVDRRTLRRAAGRIPGTSPLLGDGNVGIAGHRDGVFHQLSRAAAGDLVIVESPAGTASYRIEAVSIVPPEATQVLADTGRPTLTLVTCYPFELVGRADERWVVRARRIEPTTS